MQLPWKRASYDRKGDSNAFWHSGTSGSLVKCHVDCIWHHHLSIPSLTVMLGDQCSGVHCCCCSILDVEQRHQSADSAFTLAAFNAA